MGKQYPVFIQPFIKKCWQTDLTQRPKAMGPLVKALKTYRLKAKQRDVERMHHHAVKKAYGQAREFLDKIQSLPLHQDSAGETALHVCVKDGAILMINHLLAYYKPANLLPIVNKKGETVLHVMMKKGDQHVDALGILLKAGAKVNTQNLAGSSPLHYAADFAQVKTVKLLIAWGANLRIKDKDNATPLAVAKKRKNSQKEAGMSTKQSDAVIDYLENCELRLCKDTGWGVKDSAENILKNLDDTKPIKPLLALQHNEPPKREKNKASLFFNNPSHTQLLPPLPFIHPTTKQTLLFTRHKVSPNGDCGFTTLGITREALMQVLLSLSQSTKARKALQPEIKNLLLHSETDIPEALNTLAYKKIIKALRKVEQEKDSLMRKIKADYLEDKQVQACNLQQLMTCLQKKGENQAVKQLSDMRLQVFQKEDALNLHCKKQSTYEAYVKGYQQTPQWLGYKSALLYAKTKQLTLYILRETKNNQLVCDKGNSYLAKNPSNTIYALHTNGFTHFDLLTLAPSPSKENKQRKPSRIPPCLEGVSHGNNRKSRQSSLTS